MDPISVTAEAGLDILRRLAAGELEVHGILLRDTTGKKFRYILRGLEDLPADPARVMNLLPLEPLRAALNATQLLQVITVAQNAAIAASLRRIEASLEGIGRRLEGIEGRLLRIGTQMALTLAAHRDSALSRLKSARASALLALQNGDRTALHIAGENASEAARTLLAQARSLVRIEENSIPVALVAPEEMADLSDSAVDAARIASAICLALGGREQARSLMEEVADGLEGMRRKLASTMQDEELLIRRVAAGIGTDEQLAAAGRRLQIACQEARGREMMIETGLIGADPRRLEFEAIEPAPKGLSFMPIAASLQEQAAE